MAERRPPRRDTIAEHIDTAQAALRRRGLGEVPATRSWARDLVRDGLIAPPARGPKGSGRGRRTRFTPRGYRDLLEIMRLRACDAGHRSTWIVWLWLRGRDFPLRRVRPALIADLERQFGAFRKELSPTGRFQEPFVTKYRRNIAPKREASPFVSLGSLEEPLAAIMMRPQAVAEIAVDMDAVAVMMAQILGVEEADARNALQGMARAANPSELVSPVAALTDDAMIHGALSLIGSADGFDQVLPNLTGMIDDGRGGSTLLAAIRDATDNELLRARGRIRGVRTGEFERALHAAFLQLPAEARPQVEFMLRYARSQRILMTGNPLLGAYLFAIAVHGYATNERAPIPRLVDANAVLRYLRG